MKKVVIEKVKGKQEYDIFTSSSTMSYCTIRVSENYMRGKEKKLLSGHYLVEAHHELGGGMGGWNSYEENIGAIRNKKQLRLIAVAYARRLAKRVGASLEDRL